MSPSLAASYAAGAWASFRTPFSSRRATRRFDTLFGAFEPQVSVAWLRDLYGHDRGVRASSAGTSGRLRIGEPDRDVDGLRLGASLTYRVGEYLSVLGRVDTDVHGTADETAGVLELQGRF